MPVKGDAAGSIDWWMRYKVLQPAADNLSSGENRAHLAKHPPDRAVTSGNQ